MSAPGSPTLLKTCSQYTLTRNEGRAACGTRLLCIVIGEHQCLLYDAINVWSLVPIKFSK